MTNHGDGKRPPIPAPDLNETLAALVEVLRDQVEFSDRPVRYEDFAWSFGRDAVDAVRAEMRRDPPESILIDSQRFVTAKARRAWIESRQRLARELSS